MSKLLTQTDTLYAVMTADPLTSKWSTVDIHLL